MITLKRKLKDGRVMLLVGLTIGALATAPLGAYALSSGDSGATTATNETTSNTGDTTTTSDTTGSQTSEDPGDTTAPTVPTGLTATASDSTTVKLSWDAATDDTAVTGYNVYRDGVLLTSAAGLTYTDTGLTAATTYTYSVAAFDAAGNTSDQASTSVTTPAATTTPPTQSTVADLQSAITIATAEHPDVAVTAARISSLQGNVVYKVSFSDGWTAYVDADNGSVLLLQNAKGQNQPCHNNARKAWLKHHKQWNPWAAAFRSYSSSWVQKQTWQQHVKYSTQTTASTQTADPSAEHTTSTTQTQHVSDKHGNSWHKH